MANIAFLIRNHLLFLYKGCSMEFSDKKSIHFIGIGGSGMAPLARVALEMGHKVSGSDLVENDATGYFRSRGATIYSDQNTASLNGVGLVVVSSAIKGDNPELKRAQNLGIDIVHRSDLLNDLMKNKKAITISGTHGKTTTAAMITHILQTMGLRPTAVIGGNMLNYNTSALTGAGELFVAEADESDGTLLKYKPFINVLTNIDNDHLDYYQSFEELVDTFSRYLRKTDSEGISVIGWDNKNSKDVGCNYPGEKITYGFRIGSEIRALSYKTHHDGTEFKVVVERGCFHVKIQLIGKHNIQNALAALCVARCLNLDIKMALDALSTFKGVERRLSLKYQDDKIKIYDDYAHNPGKISSSIQATREAYPDFKICVIFQPHRFSRLETMYNETVAAFKNADLVYVLPVFSAGEAVNNDYCSPGLAEDIAKHSSTRTCGVSDFNRCLENITASLNEPTVFLTLGAGNVHVISTRLKELLNDQRKKEV